MYFKMIAIAVFLQFIFVNAFRPNLSSVKTFYNKNNLYNAQTQKMETNYVLSQQISGTVERIVSLCKELFELREPTLVNIVRLCDKADATINQPIESFLVRFLRYNLLSTKLKDNRSEYIEIAGFLSNRIPRSELPNLQNVPLSLQNLPSVLSNDKKVEVDTIVDDCLLPDASYNESLLDKILLPIFRSLVQKEINYKSDVGGIKGLLAEGRYYKLSEEGRVNDSVNQHRYVKNVLGAILTPVMPPLYRLFMAGIVPSAARGDPIWLAELTESLISALPLSEEKKQSLPGQQFGPWFYAPVLTSVFTPPFMSFLVGPSRTNLRKDGNLGGMVVEKCKFLQESNCKGLCLHQCKIPAQEFFQENLGLALTVSPNFVTQECQWSWGEVPLNHLEDKDFPRGCNAGCQTRSLIV